jgi:hypothetical protein
LLAKIGAARPARAADFPFYDLRCGPIDGARAVELFAATGSLHIGAGRQRPGRGALHRALSPTFPAGAMVFFIPSRGVAEDVAEDSGAAHPDRQTDPHPPPGWWCSGCWPPMVMSPPAPIPFSRYSGSRPTRQLADRSDRGGAGELSGHRQAAASKAQRHRAAWLVQRLLTADGDVAGGADELPGHRQGAASKAQRHRSAPAHYGRGNVAHPVDGISIVRLNCACTSMLLPLKS